MTMNRSALAAIGIAGVIAAGAAIPAIAQDATDDTAPEESTDDILTREDRHAAFAEALAAELGLDTATVSDAVDAVRDEMQAAREAEMQERIQARLDALVESGELTQQEADTLAQIQERGVFRDQLGGFGRRGHHGPFDGGPGPWGADAATTDATSA